MRITTRRSATIAAFAAFTLVLGACGGDDDDDAAAATAEDDGGDAADETGDEIVVDDLDDMPEECVDAMGDFLERIEPIVEDIDFENADASIFEDIGAQIDEEASEMEDPELEAKCAQYSFGDDGDFEAIKEVARDRAPGVLAFIEFQEQMIADLADMTIPEISIPDITLPEISIPDITLPEISIPDISIPDISLAADLPTTCEDAIAYVEDLIEEHGTMGSLDLSGITAFGQVSTVISTDCSIDEMSEFYGRADVQQFMTG